MPSSYFEYMHKKTAARITIFLLIIIISAAVIGILFPSINDRDSNKKKKPVLNTTQSQEHVNH